MTERQQNLLIINFVTLLSAGPTVLAKLIALPALSIVFGRALFGVMGAYLFIRWQKQTIKPKSGRDLVIFLIIGSCMAAHWVLLFYAVQISTVAIGIIAVNTQLIMTILAEPFFFKEKFQWIDLGLAAVTFLGLFILVPAFELSNDTTLGVICGVLSAFFWTVRTLVTRKFVERYPASVVMGYQLFTVALVLAIPALFYLEMDWGEFFSGRMLLLAVVFTALAHSLYVQVLKVLQAKTASLIGVLQIPYTVLTGVIFLAEYPPTRTIIGGLIIASVVIVENIRAQSE